MFAGGGPARAAVAAGRAGHRRPGHQGAVFPARLRPPRAGRGAGQRRRHDGQQTGGLQAHSLPGLTVSLSVCLLVHHVTLYGLYADDVRVRVCVCVRACVRRACMCCLNFSPHMFCVHHPFRECPNPTNQNC